MGKSAEWAAVRRLQDAAHRLAWREYWIRKVAEAKRGVTDSDG